MTRIPLTAALCLLTGVLAFSVSAPMASAEDVDSTVVVSKLDNPSGVVVNPESGHVFVASRAGVYRYDPLGHKAYLEVIGFPTDVYGKGPKYNVGPLGVAWLDNKHLIVGDGSRKDGDELVRIYEVGPKPLEEPKEEGDAVHTLGPIEAGEKSARGEGNFYGVAVASGQIFVTCNGDDTKGWISAAKVKNGKPGKLVPTIATKEAVGVDAPVGITTSDDGKDLVVSQMGEMNVPGDSLLTIYDAKSGKLKNKYETGLHDIAGVAYSPKTGKLYAVDFAWSDTSKGGLFELTIDGDKVKTSKVLSLDKPTALAFDKDGALYITQFGSAEEGSEDLPGSVVRIDPGL